MKAERAFAARACGAVFALVLRCCLALAVTSDIYMNMNKWRWRGAGEQGGGEGALFVARYVPRWLVLGVTPSLLTPSPLFPAV